MPMRRLRRSLHLEILTGFLLLLVACVLAVMAATNSHNAYDLVNHSTHVRRTISDLFGELRDAEAGQRGYLLAGDRSYLQPYMRALDKLPQTQSALQALTAHDRSQAELVSRLDALIPPIMAELAQVIALHDAGHQADAMAAVKSGQGLRLMQKAQLLLETLDANETSRETISLRQVHNRQQQLLWSIVTTIALVFMLAIMVVRDQAKQRYEVEFKNAVLREQIDHQQATEAQLRQAQKMEALGQLTGGIAHDFNNMLAIVVGNLEIALRRLHKDTGSIEKFIHNALLGAGKASDLTRRLLAFSRRQPLHPTPVDVNACVHEMSSILSRSLGENITIALVPCEHLWAAFVDKSQLESAILNLAVNARDAMEDRGQLTIETANAYLDENYARQNTGVSSGDYVMVAVSDTGHGMSQEVLRKVFEPFFTTKGVGKGTGLGLAQIHGFLAQSKGHIKIHSEVGTGTSVKLYLPRAGAHHPAKAAKHNGLVAALPHAVLVVEDNAEVRDFVTMALEELGYTALQAESAKAAEAMLRAHPEISILLTDVVMPGDSGAQLADVVTKRHPQLRVLLMSGYASEIVERATTPHCRFRLLTKPFTIQELAEALRSVLNDDAAAAVHAK